MSEYFVDGIGPAFNTTMARHGRLTIFKIVSINGYLYNQFGIIGANAGSSEPPSMDNPVVAERVERGKQAFINKSWKADLERWDNIDKPDSIERNVKLASVDIDALNHDELVEYLQECRDNCAVMIRRHHTFSFLAKPTASLFYDHAMEWTRLELQQLLLLLDGASPISTGFSPEIENVVLAIKDDESARAILNSNPPAATQVDILRELSGAVGEAMDRFILMDGHRLANSFDLQGQCLYELPETIIDRLNDAVANGFVDRTKEAEEDVEFVRTLVPAEHIAKFNELLADARQIARIKDERGLYCDICAGGIMRKAILGAGRRLADEGVISNPLKSATR